MDKPPTAEQVGRVIVEASRITGCNPLDVAGKVKSTPRDPSIARARAYAALVMEELFPENGSVSIAKMVGANSPDCYLSSFKHAMAKAGIPWWRDDVYVGLARTCVAKLSLEDPMVYRKPQALLRR
jgi:hypothetical protein